MKRNLRINRIGRDGHRSSRRRPLDVSAWLGAGALTVGIGAALAGGAGVASADAGHVANSVSQSTGATSPTGPRAVKSGGLVKRTPAETATPPKASAAITLRHASPAATTVAAPAAAATTPAAKASAPPRQKLLNLVTNALLNLGGMNTTTPSPAKGNLGQLVLYSSARWLQDTFNPGGIPQAGTPSVGTPNRDTGAVHFTAPFTDAQTSALAYKIAGQPGLGTVTRGADGTYTYTPSTAARLRATVDGNLTDQVTITAYNGVQNTSQTVQIPMGPVSLSSFTINVGDSPSAVGLSPTGTQLVVTTIGDNNASVIDTQTDKVVATVPVGAYPGGVAVTPDGVGAYVVNYQSDNVSVLSFLTNTVVATFTVGTGPGFAAVGRLNTPAANRLYVSNEGVFQNPGSTVSVLNATTGAPVTTITVGVGPAGLALSPDQTRLYVANIGEQQNWGNTVSVINTATNTVTATIPVGTGPMAVAVNADGTRVYVANYVGNSVSVIDTGTNAVTATIPIGSPSAMTFSPDGSVVYVTNRFAGAVSAIDTATNTVITSIPTGTYADGVAVSHNGNWLYVANQGDDTVSVINV